MRWRFDLRQGGPSATFVAKRLEWRRSAEEKPMIKRTLTGVSLLVMLLLPGMASAQAPSPEARAVARELIATSRAADHVQQLFPSIVNLMKPAIVQGRPQVEKDFDAFAPLLLQSLKGRMDELIEEIVVVYATNFTVAEMKDIMAFYKGPAGQKFLAKAPIIAQQSMAAGQKLGAQIGREIQTRMIEELKKKGHNI
jgi:hypothetical protein